MTVFDLLQQLHAVGVILTPYLDGTLHYKAPKGTLTPELLNEMREQKAALVILLEECGERSAIMEYDGGLAHAEAVRLAWACVVKAEKTQPEAGAATPAS